ncbi:hypothetical protein ACFL96_03215 [Thermoproteota archaeon]
MDIVKQKQKPVPQPPQLSSRDLAEDALKKSYNEYMDLHENPGNDSTFYTRQNMARTKLMSVIDKASSVGCGIIGPVGSFLKEEHWRFFSGMIDTDQYFEDLCLAMNTAICNETILGYVDQAYTVLESTKQQENRKELFQGFKEGLEMLIDLCEDLDRIGLRETLSQQYLNRTEAILTEYEQNDNGSQDPGGP